MATDRSRRTVFRRCDRFEELEQRRVLDAHVLIAEFVADNESGLRDDDGDRSDWIEVRNVGDEAVDLGGWSLTDNAEDLTKWKFPSRQIGPRQSETIFASGKNRTSDRILHTNFRLQSSGEYLALVRPDGTVAHDFSPQYPPQFSDVSFGLSQNVISEPVVTKENALTYFVPTSENGAELQNRWLDPQFDDSSWKVGVGGIGYGTSLSDLIDTDVRDELSAVGSSLFVRVQFAIESPSSMDSLTLQINYDDAFVAYINGHELARDNFSGEPQYDSTAETSRSSSAVATPETFTIDLRADAFRDILSEQGNVLAIHGMNLSQQNSDFLIRAELVASQPGEIVSDAPRFFETPTPSSPNGTVSFAGKVDDLQVSVGRGFYDQPQSVSITTSLVGASIVYTTDGSVPSRNNGIIVDAADADSTPTLNLQIDKTTTLRTIAIKVDFIDSAYETNSYVFLDDVVRQSDQGEAPDGWPVDPINGQVFDYGMDPDIVDDPEYGPLLKDALRDIPSFSIVTDQAHLFDGETGIYVNGTAARGNNSEWERPTSVELIYPDGAEGFQINAGLRLRGGASRRNDNPKHSFRLLFREEYGSAKLNYPLFGEEGVDAFDNIDLRTAQAPSWNWEGTASQHTMLREVFSRDTQRDMGNPHTRSQYYHLYLNGQYWGIYQTQERAEASFGEAYLGGDKDNYDVVKVEPFPHHVAATDGNDEAWRQLWEISRDGFDNEESYMQVQGRNANGTRNPELPVLLDVDNLIDYALIIFYTGDLDAAITNFGDNEIANNFYAMRDRTGDRGFQFFSHDAEWTLMNVNENRLGPWPAGDTYDQANPQWLHQQLMHNDDYRLRFADRVEKHLYNDGALSIAAALNRVQARADQLQLAIVAESARWGDHRRPNRPYTKADWENAVRQITETYIPNRTEALLSQFRNARIESRTGPSAPLVSLVDTPQLSRFGGQVESGFELNITSDSNVYYTTDGTDPRLRSPTLERSTLLPSDSPLRFLVPKDDSLQNDWTMSDFDDSQWKEANGGIGHGRFGDALVTDIEADIKGVNTSLYARIPFEVGEVEFDVVDLELQIDDGAIVYLNGTEVTRRNAPDVATWDSTASAANRNSDTSEQISLTKYLELIQPGRNMLAIHGLNQTIVSDFFLGVELTVATVVDSGVDPNAKRYEQPIRIDLNTNVRARAFDGEWSALADAVFTTEQNPLRVTELMYHPADPTDDERAAGFTNSEQFEYVEFTNTSVTEPIELRGISVSGGVTFEFPVTTLGPNQSVVVTKDEQAFRHRYGDKIRVAGEFSNQLSNSGEAIRVADAIGILIQEFQYRDSWYGETDGGGSSLVSIAAAADLADWSEQTGWRQSLRPDGSPGTPDLTPGDANRDGVFDSKDFVLIFQAAEYEDELIGNSSWNSGDWNGDGEFDTSDLVFAFQTGSYQ